MNPEPLTPSQFKYASGRIASLLLREGGRGLNDLYLMQEGLRGEVDVSFRDPQSTSGTNSERTILLSYYCPRLEGAFTTIIQPRRRKVTIRTKTSPIPLHFEVAGNDKDWLTISQWTMEQMDKSTTITNLQYLAGLRQHPFIGRATLDNHLEEPSPERTRLQQQPLRCRLILPIKEGYVFKEPDPDAPDIRW